MTGNYRPRAIARHFNAKGFAQRVQPVRVMVKVRVVPVTPGAKKALGSR